MATDAVQTRLPWKLVAWLSLAFTLALLDYAARFAGPKEPSDLAYRWSSSIGAVFQYGVMLAILLLIARGLPRRDAFALRRPASWPRALALAGGALLAIWGVGLALAPFLHASEEQGLVPKEWDPNRAGAFAAFFVTVTIVAPVVEELTYRGLGFTLLSPYGTGTALVVTAVLFATAHGLVVGLPVLIFFGLAIGWVRARTDSVYPTMLLHGTFNGVTLIAAVSIATSH